MRSRDSTRKSKRVHGRSYPEYAAPVLRRINHVQSSTLNPRPIISFGKSPGGLYKLVGFAMKRWPITALMKDQQPVSNYVRKKFANEFTASNSRLSSMLDNRVDLSEYP
jgi:hypothetical protein